MTSGIWIRGIESENRASPTIVELGRNLGKCIPKRGDIQLILLLLISLAKQSIGNRCGIRSFSFGEIDKVVELGIPRTRIGMLIKARIRLLHGINRSPKSHVSR